MSVASVTSSASVTSAPASGDLLGCAAPGSPPDGAGAAPFTALLMLFGTPGAGPEASSRDERNTVGAGATPERGADGAIVTAGAEMLELIPSFDMLLAGAAEPNRLAVLAPRTLTGEGRRPPGTPLLTAVGAEEDPAAWSGTPDAQPPAALAAAIASALAPVPPLVAAPVTAPAGAMSATSGALDGPLGGARASADEAARPSAVSRRTRQPSDMRAAHAAAVIATAQEHRAIPALGPDPARAAREAFAGAEHALAAPRADSASSSAPAAALAPAPRGPGSDPSFAAVAGLDAETLAATAPLVVTAGAPTTGEERSETSSQRGARSGLAEAPPVLPVVPGGTVSAEASPAGGPAVAAQVSALPAPAGAEPPLAAQVVRAARLLARGDLTQVDVELAPPELGAIRVRASTERAGGSSLTITAERVETRDLLLAALPALRQALAGHGMAPLAITITTVAVAGAEPALDPRRDPVRRESPRRERPGDERPPSWPRARRNWAPVGALDLTV
jgi:hypothetical protein